MAFWVPCPITNCFSHICLVFGATNDWVNQFGIILLLNSRILTKINLQSHFKENREPQISHRYFHQSSKILFKEGSVVTFMALGSYNRPLPDMPAAWDLTLMTFQRTERFCLDLCLQVICNIFLFVCLFFKSNTVPNISFYAFFLAPWLLIFFFVFLSLQ